MTAIIRLSNNYDYDAQNHDFDSWQKHHAALLANCGSRERKPMVIGNGNPVGFCGGMTLEGWLSLGGASRNVSAYSLHSHNWPSDPQDIRPTPLSEYPS